MTEIIIEPDVVLAMLGGKWPDSGKSKCWPSGFSWEEVGEFRVEDGLLVPYSGGLPAPGPDFRLTMV